MFPDLEKILGQKLPSPDQLHTDEARAVLDSICVAKGKCSILPATVAQHVAHLLIVGVVKGLNLGLTPRHN